MLEFLLGDRKKWILKNKRAKERKKREIKDLIEIISNKY